jgi:predicted Zn-dependent protease
MLRLLPLQLLQSLRPVLPALGLLMAAGSQAVEIGEVLERSQQQRLDAGVPAAADSERARRIRESFDHLVQLAPTEHPVELRILQGGLQAEAMLGRVLVVGESVGDLPEGERLMLLAHEYGHLSMGHWSALVGLYRQHIPGEVRPDTTDPVAGTLGAQGQQMSHRHEYEADAFGFALVRRLGIGLDEALSLLMRRPVNFDSPTHPATRRRIAQLRSIQMAADTGSNPTASGSPPVARVSRPAAAASNATD